MVRGVFRVNGQGLEGIPWRGDIPWVGGGKAAIARNEGAYAGSPFKGP